MIVLGTGTESAYDIGLESRVMWWLEIGCASCTLAAASLHYTAKWCLLPSQCQLYTLGFDWLNLGILYHQHMGSLKC